VRKYQVVCSRKWDVTHYLNPSPVTQSLPGMELHPPFVDHHINSGA